jgi:uncharacterized membrane protein YbhN (UPF0104 family)
MLVPASPGYVGTFELVVIKGMENVFDVGSNAATSYALVQHAFLYLAPMVVAAVYLWRERGTWQKMRLWIVGRTLTEAPAATGGESGQGLGNRSE